MTLCQAFNIFFKKSIRTSLFQKRKQAYSFEYMMVKNDFGNKRKTVEYINQNIFRIEILNVLVHH